MTPDLLDNELKQGKLNSIYLFYGEELFLLENAVKKIKKLFEYKPKVFKWQVIAGCVLFFLVNALLFLIIVYAEWFTGFDGEATLLCGAMLVVFDLVVCFFAVKYINNLDKIIVVHPPMINV